MRVWIIAALLLVTGLAGCAGDDAAPQDTENQKLESLELEATETTGVIRGVVVDNAIRPLAGVTVKVVGQEEPMEVKTTEDGLFGFDGLEAGSYFVTAEKIGFTGTQSSVEVVAGVADPTATRLMLESDPGSMPYYEVFQYTGFIECSTAAVAARLAACSLPNTGSEITCDVSGQCFGNLTNDKFLPRHMTAGMVPDFVQSEMVWDATQAAGNKLYALPGTYVPDGGFSDKASFGGFSPVVMPMNGSLFAELGDGQGYQIRVFTGYADETAGLLGVTLQQEFEIVSHLFYNFKPAEGWQFSQQGNPTPPS